MRLQTTRDTGPQLAGQFRTVISITQYVMQILYQSCTVFNMFVLIGILTICSAGFNHMVAVVKMVLFTSGVQNPDPSAVATPL